jgi:hypothetical protein
MRLLLDECVPARLKKALFAHAGLSLRERPTPAAATFITRQIPTCLHIYKAFGLQ